MAVKTKAELETEIAAQKAQITELRYQIEKVSQQEQNDKSAEQFWDIYQSYIKAGFTDEQAWTLVTMLLNNATTKKSIF